jgi:hypothetical protein
MICKNCIHSSVCRLDNNVYKLLDEVRFKIKDDNLTGYRLDSKRLLDDFIVVSEKHIKESCKYYGAIK